MFCQPIFELIFPLSAMSNTLWVVKRKTLYLVKDLYISYVSVNTQVKLRGYCLGQRVAKPTSTRAGDKRHPSSVLLNSTVLQGADKLIFTIDVGGGRWEVGGGRWEI